MGLTEYLTESAQNMAEIKSETDALLSYANETTGAEDVRLGDAVRTLASGYGAGEGVLQLPTGAKVVTVIDGQEYIDVSSIGDYGYGIKIDGDYVKVNNSYLYAKTSVAFAWNPNISSGKSITVFSISGDNTAGGSSQSNSSYYMGYDVSTHRVLLSTYSKKQCVGTWILIPYAVN